MCDPRTLNETERHHAALLAAHGLEHLDFSAITMTRRPVTQTIAADLHDRLDAAAVRFPSKHDGSACVAVFEGRGTLVAAGDVFSLLDPPPPALEAICADWNLKLEPAAP